MTGTLLVHLSQAQAAALVDMARRGMAVASDATTQQLLDADDARIVLVQALDAAAPAPTPEAPRPRCPACQAPLRPRGLPCWVCGWVMQSE